MAGNMELGSHNNSFMIKVSDTLYSSHLPPPLAFSLGWLFLREWLLLGFEVRALHLLGRCCIQSILLYFGDRSLLLAQTSLNHNPTILSFLQLLV
jgi:hypothetical protein